MSIKHDKKIKNQMLIDEIFKKIIKFNIIKKLKITL